MQIKGRSLTRPNIIYVYDTAPDWRYDPSARIIGQNFLEFDTLGDGDTQHTPLRCTGGAYFGDYVMSMRVPLRDAILNGRVEYFPWNADVPDSEVEQYAAVKYDPSKRRWYSTETGTLRTSTSESKKHDKRWHEVPEWADGTLQSAFELRQDAVGRFHDLPSKVAWLSRAQRLLGFSDTLSKLCGYPDVDAWEFSNASSQLDTLSRLTWTLSAVNRWSDGCAA